jgi:rare lipoprotein A
MTAAHKTLPLPTYAMVTNLDNGRRVVVKVNDRGPFVGDRIIDLSYAAAKRLDMINSGIARVEVRSVDPRDHGKDGRDLLRLAAAAADTPANSETAESVPTSRRSPAPMSAAPSAARTAAMQPRPGSSSSPAPAAASGLYVQVGAFGDRVNAEQLQSRLVAAVEEPVLVRPAPALGSAPLYKVQVGPLRSPTDADALGRRLAALGINTSLIVTP